MLGNQVPRLEEIFRGIFSTEANEKLVWNSREIAESMCSPSPPGCLLLREMQLMEIKQ